LDPGNQDKSELELRKACREAKGKDERFVSHCKKTTLLCAICPDLLSIKESMICQM